MRILIAEDDAISRRLLETILVKWGYEVVSASDGAHAWQLLEQPDAPQLAILDWMMPSIDGIELCRRVRARGDGATYTYLLLLTARSEREDVVQGLDAGADDYVTKPFDTNELKVRLRAGRRILDLQTQLIAAQEQLRDQASRDPLTGIWNRKAIFEILVRELTRSEREGVPLSIAMADLDHFKTLNDTWGHMAGDAVLRESTRRMANCIRPYDALGRYGGEEFLVILPGCDTSAGQQQAERLRLSIADQAFDTSEGRMTVTCSFGVASTSSGHSDVSSLVRAADAALYRAKKSGRNCIAE